jgi:hypothetical protein
VICYTGSPIVSIGSTLVWLLSLAIAIAASLKDKSITGDNLPIVIINTVAWATVMLNVGYPCWPPFAFVLLVLLFLVELLYDLDALAQ